MDKIRWGIVGTGGIAHRFANAVKNVDGAVLTAVASRKAETADRFADEFGIPHRFSSYEDMAKSDEIDAAYIGVPHGCHADSAILFLKEKKAVLCEKPMTVNAKEAKRMFDCARENGTFLMEAMWGRMTDGTKRVLEIVKSGEIGEVRGVSAAFCYDMSDEPDHHAFKTKYGGGSLLDVGVYGLNFASWYIDSEPEKISAFADIDENGVDIHCCELIKYKNGAIADISSAMRLIKPNEGYIYGTAGYIKVGRFYAPEKIEIHKENEPVRIIETPYIGNGFEEQIIEADSCIRNGFTECPYVTHSHTMYIIRQMDEIRKQVGVKYPQD